MFLHQKEHQKAVQMLQFFFVSDCDWFNGCVALRVGSLDVFEVMKVQIF